MQEAAQRAARLLEWLNSRVANQAAAAELAAPLPPAPGSDAPPTAAASAALSAALHARRMRRRLHAVLLAEVEPVPIVSAVKVVRGVVQVSRPSGATAAAMAAAAAAASTSGAIPAQAAAPAQQQWPDPATAAVVRGIVAALDAGACGGRTEEARGAVRGREGKGRGRGSGPHLTLRNTPVPPNMSALTPQARWS